VEVRIAPDINVTATRQLERERERELFLRVAKPLRLFIVLVVLFFIECRPFQKIIAYWFYISIRFLGLQMEFMIYTA